MRDLWSLEVQRDLIKWAKECEDRAHKKRAGDREDWKREQSQIEDRLVCRKWRAERWEGEAAGRKERAMRRTGKRKEEERQKGKEKTYKRESKRSWSGYETNSDLIWRVYDSMFSFFPRSETQAGIRLGGGLGWAQRKARDRKMGVFSTVVFYLLVWVWHWVQVWRSGWITNTFIQMHTAAPEADSPEHLSI